MNPIEKYDEIISDIEEMISADPYKGTKRITYNIKKNTGFEERDLSVIFKFFTEMSLSEYIKKRKMNYSYLKMKELPKFKLDEIIEYTQYSDQPAYTKAFKKEYGVPPKQAYDSDVDMKKPPLTMEVLRTNKNCYAVSENLEKINEEKLYNKFVRISAEYKEFYGFGEVPAKIAYEYAMDNKIALEEAFDKILDIFIDCEDVMGKDIDYLDEQHTRKMLESCVPVFEACESMEMEMGDIRGLYRSAKAYGVSILEEEDEFIYNYMNTRAEIYDFVKYYKFYLKHKNQFSDSDDIEEYFRKADMYGDCELALDIVTRESDITSYSQAEIEYDDYDYYDDIDECDKDFYGNDLSYDGERYNPEDPFDERYDPDNPEYYFED